MLALYADHYALPLPEGHRFPIAKYTMLRQRLSKEMPALQMLPAPSVSDAELALAHSADYVAALVTGTLAPGMMREIGLPWSEQMVERSRRSVGATVSAVCHALSQGVAISLAGGTHHAYANRGSGFCVFNDVAVAIKLVQAQPDRARLKVAVIDLDVHQGNGTASIFERDASVYTLSLHGEKNFPFRKEHSDLDIGLPDGCGDADYLRALDCALAQLSQDFAPDLVIYLAGADPHEGDRLGRLKLSYAGLQARDARVMQWCWQRGVPFAVAMAGGYGVEIESTVQIHASSCELAWRYWALWQSRQPPGEVTGRMVDHDFKQS